MFVFAKEGMLCKKLPLDMPPSLLWSPIGTSHKTSLSLLLSIYVLLPNRIFTFLWGPWFHCPQRIYSGPPQLPPLCHCLCPHRHCHPRLGSNSLHNIYYHSRKCLFRFSWFPHGCKFLHRIRILSLMCWLDLPLPVPWVHMYRIEHLAHERILRKADSTVCSDRIPWAIETHEETSIPLLQAHLLHPIPQQNRHAPRQSLWRKFHLSLLRPRPPLPQPKSIMERIIGKDQICTSLSRSSQLIVMYNSCARGGQHTLATWTLWSSCA